jgi:putative ABC transport system permease protein
MSWLRRLWNTFRPDRVHRDIDRELAFHLAERTDQLRSEGLSEDDARRLARRRFGNVTLQAERTRDADISLGLDGWLRDLRYSIRSLARTPGFTCTVVLTLTLGIGANSAVFSAIDAVILRPLPFPDADRLMMLRQTQERTAESHVAPIRLEDWQRLNTTFESLTGFYVEDVSDTSGDLPEKVRRAFIAPRFLEVWGTPAAIGRGFTAEEHRGNGTSAVLISDRYWRRRLGANPNVLNSTVRIGNAAFPIIGVMPASFLFPDRDVDLWFAVSIDNKYAQSRLATWYTAIGRLKPQVTVDQARANLAAVQAQLGEQYPETDAKIGVQIAPLKELTVGAISASLWLVFAAVTVLLLITCANVAALLLSRGTHRQQEIALRLSLGASRRAVVRQMLVETGLLALVGGAAGIAVAAGASAALRTTAVTLPRVDEIALDWRILAYTLGITVAVALLSGVLPAVRTVSRDGSGGGQVSPGRGGQVSPKHSLQWILVGAQVALSVTLLAGAGLLLRSIQELSRVDPGFNPAHVLAFRVSGDFGETADYPRLIARIDRSVDALRALPGVASVATSMTLPGVPNQYEASFQLQEGGTANQPRLVAEHRVVSPDYFATMEIPLREGELCRRLPDRSVIDVMVNRTFAARYLSDRPSPIGLHLTDASPGASPRRITGVVADARERGLDRDPAPTVYSCFNAPNPTPYFLLRTHGDPLALAQTVRLTVKDVSPLRSVYDVAALEERIDGAFAENRLRTWLLVLFAATALSLAAIGLYGTVSYAVGLRRREIGLRLALGARRGEVIRQFLRQGLRVVALASVVGLALSAALKNLVAGMLYGVAASDPATLAGVITGVAAVTTLAVLVPAVRAALIEPMQVLRDE